MWVFLGGGGLEKNYLPKILEQGCQTYGPQAKTDPVGGWIQLAFESEKMNKHYMFVVCQIIFLLNMNII